MSEEEGNKSEQATPFKLRKAREKGMVARGQDLGFLLVLCGLLLFLLMFSTRLISTLAEIMRLGLGSISSGSDPQQALALSGQLIRDGLPLVAALGLTLVVLVLPAEIIQLRGLVFSTQPLKPDFSRINPAKGFKRLFSVRMLKEALKAILKFLLYTTAATFAIRWTLSETSRAPVDARQVGGIIWQGSVRLLCFIALVAVFLAIVDQLLSRREFAKQMRMSRSELTREHKEREGEPRIKARRKQLHQEFVKQTRGLQSLPGSDMLIVNPDHYAVALVYRADTMDAPQVRTKARNRLALAMRAEAARLGIVVIADPPLARDLFKRSQAGQAIPEDHFRTVALHYARIRTSTGASGV